MAIRDKIWEFLCEISPWKETVIDQIAKIEDTIKVLDNRRNGINEGIIELEKKEAEYLQEGRDAASAKKTIVVKRLCARLAAVRRDLKHQNTLANMHAKQIQIQSTNANNLRLAQEAKWLQLPTIDSLAANCVEAEQHLENIGSLAQSAEDMDAGMEMDMSDNEMSIMEEFESDAVSEETHTKVVVPETAVAGEVTDNESILPTDRIRAIESETDSV